MACIYKNGILVIYIHRVIVTNIFTGRYYRRNGGIVRLAGA